MTTPTLREALTEFTTEALMLAAAVSAASDAQWLPSSAPKPREDTTERASGGHSDPTANTALDDRRLALRAEHDAALAQLTALAESARASRVSLDGALHEWAGGFS